MRPRGALLLLAALVGATAAQACGQDLDARERRVIATPRLQLAYAARPAPLAVGRHFALDIVVCTEAGTPAPLALVVDAQMPAHRHGMNYRPTVRALGDGRYRADGLLLHMPGRWQLRFELSVDGRIERLVHEIELQ